MIGATYVNPLYVISICLYLLSAILNSVSKLGLNVDFAPDADVLTNQKNAVIGDRSFGSDPEFVTDCAVAYAEGLRENGVLSTFKHFPGHGATTDDTHKGFAYSDKTLDELKESELVPFMRAKDADILVMLIIMAISVIYSFLIKKRLRKYFSFIM